MNNQKLEGQIHKTNVFMLLGESIKKTKQNLITSLLNEKKHYKQQAKTATTGRNPVHWSVSPLIKQLDLQYGEVILHFI